MNSDITPGFYRIEGLGQDREGRMFVRVTPDLTVWGLSVYDADGEGPTAEYRTHGCRLSAAMVVWPREQWHADHDRRAEAQAEHDKHAAIRITVTTATLRRAEALGWTPGEGDVLLWVLREAEGWRKQYRRACVVATELHNTCAKLEAERDAGRSDLARIVQLCGWDCDGNDPETPAGAIHLYGDAVQAVRELVESDDPEGVARRSDLMDAGHSNHCAARMVWGDGSCTCGRDTDTDRSTT